MYLFEFFEMDTFFSMSQGLTVNFDYIANNIQTYIGQDNFYDIVDKDDIPKVLEKPILNLTISSLFFLKANQSIVHLNYFGLFESAMFSLIHSKTRLTFLIATKRT